MIRNKITGTGIAIVTPFRKDGSVDFKALEKLVNFLVDGGVNYIVVLGTTGETPVLSKDEKKAVVSSVIEVINKRIPVVMGIGGNSTGEVLEAIKSTAYDGIDAILSVSPYYNKPGQEGIYQHFKMLAEACPLPVIIYNVPGRTGSNISADTCLRLARDTRGQIAAVKEASGNISQIMNIARDKPAGFLLISGDDGITLPIISVGGAGVISVIGNAFPADFSRMVTLAISGKYEEARKIHFKLLPAIDLAFAEGSPTGIKAFLEILGIISNNLRLPLVPASRELYRKIENFMKNY
jgi:4-hydroxy-tetrahydrodipicolinate synthase